MLNSKELDGKLIITIESDMTIYCASDLREKLNGLCCDSLDIELDLSNVNELDISGVQILMSAKKLREKVKGNLTITQHSKVVVDAFETLGLVPYFGDPVYLSNN